jgi:pyrophosphatase PpaX
LKGVIFDLDGTLADTLPICILALQQALAAYTGKHFTAAEVRATFGPSEEGVLLQHIPDRWTEALDTYIQAYEAEHYTCTAPFPGITEALALASSRGVKLAVVTGKGPRSAVISLRQIGLQGHFDLVEAGSPDGPVKPKSIQKVLGRWGLPPAGVAYVGDTQQDMRDALAAGLIPIGAAWAATATVQPPSQDDAHLVFTTVDDFILWIDGATKRPGHQ